MTDNLAAYYHERAKEYDKVYQIKAEQNDLHKAALIFQHLFSDKKVLEIACGTGYWTEKIAKTAKSVFATDINASVIDIAKTRNQENCVQFEVVDMYKLHTIHQFDAVFGGFIWSHIPIQNLTSFMNKLGEILNQNGDLVFIDSKQINGGMHDKKNCSRKDEYGNTFQNRFLENGTIHEVLKNFPSHEFIFLQLSNIATEIKVIDLDYYWIVTCKKLRNL